MNSGIYKIERIATGQMYIGSAVKFAVRWRIHRSELNLQRHHSPTLQRAWNKYGKKAFAFTVLLICDKENLLFFEQRALDRLKPVYNCNPIAGSQLGMTHSEETRVRIRAARARQVFSEETRALLSRIRTGKKFSPERCARMSAARKGKKSTIPRETWTIIAAKVSAANTGRTRSEEQRRHISEAKKGKPFSPEHRAKCTAGRAAWLLANPPVKKPSKYSDVGRQNMSLSAIVRFKTNPPLRDALGRVVSASTGGAPVKTLHSRQITT